MRLLGKLIPSSAGSPMEPGANLYFNSLVCSRRAFPVVADRVAVIGVSPTVHFSAASIRRTIVALVAMTGNLTNESSRHYHMGEQPRTRHGSTQAAI